MAIPLLQEHSTLLYTALALAVSLLLFILYNSNSKRKSLNLPPAPPGWPIVGNLLQVAFYGKHFLFYYREQLLPKYGPIVRIEMGARTMIVLSSVELAREALIEKGQSFANRPSENPTRIVYSCNKFTVNSALYGPEWRSLRRNMVSGMLSSTRLKEFRSIRENAMDRLVARIGAEAEANGGIVSVLKNARFAVFCILLSMCFGLDLEVKTIEKVDRVLKKVLMVLMPRFDDFLPLLSPLFRKQWKEVMETRRIQMDTIVPLIEERRRILKDPNYKPGNAAGFSYLDSLLDLKVEGRKSAPSDAELVTLCSELLNGGTDTTATGIEWAIARLIEKPEIQNRLYDEIVATVGDRKDLQKGLLRSEKDHLRWFDNYNLNKVDEKDTEKMVYLNAFIKELLRRHPPTHFSLTHAPTEPATIGGYDIPMGASVELYLPGISEDPNLWKDPKAFNPDRFITGGEDADLMGIGALRMIPFGAGRRVCPGLSMGMTHIALMVARMVQAFEWKESPNHPLNFDDKVEFTVVMDPTLQAMVRPRKQFI